MDASEYIHYLPHSVEKGALVVLVSQSGESPEMKRLAVSLDHPFVAITNNESSTLARAADAVLPMVAGEEKATTNRTFTNTIAVCLALAAPVMGEDPGNIFDLLLPIPDQMDELLAGWRKKMEPAAEFTGTPPHFDIVGRGPSLATVWQGGLILRELARLKGGWFSAGVFRHGLVPSMRDGGLLIMVSPPEGTADLNRVLVDDVLALGGRVLMVTDHDEKPADRLSVCRIPQTDEHSSPLLSIIPLELLGILLAERQGLDPGSEIAKVTVKE
jgi:glucosamine--fructose-6-phosphate aminotransferase (isomerizing)